MSLGRGPGVRPNTIGSSELVALFVAALFVVSGLCCYLAGGIGALVLNGHFATAPPEAVITLALDLLRHPGDPALGWPAATRRLVPSFAFVDPFALSLLVGAAAFGRVIWKKLASGNDRKGFASTAEIREGLSVGALQKKRAQVRPGLSSRRFEPTEVGLYLGREVTSRTPLWASLEDSFLVLGPPRSGKGVSLIIPSVIDAPGAAVVTSTRPDVLRHTAFARRAPIEVFDPQGASGWPTRLRWSPVSGCEDPLTAILRARSFAAGVGFERTTSDADFWSASAAAVIRAYLHAAALGERTITDVLSWAGRPGDTEPVRILRSDPRAAGGWADELASQAAADGRTRDGVWAGVRRAFDCLADPRVLDACSPKANAFDPDHFLNEHGTLYVIGSAGAQLSVAPLITALVEDLAERAQTIAARSPHGRLDPPLTLFLDEAANIAPLASLPTLLSAGGGSGICTLVVLQSLAQARARWGQNRADAIWDASTVRVVLGGLGHVDDLTKISRLAGEVDEEIESASRGAGGTSWSRSVRRRPVLPLERIRSLEPGRALVLHRRTPPVEAMLDPWWARPSASRVTAALEAAERASGPPPVISAPTARVAATPIRGRIEYDLGEEPVA